MPPIPGLDSVDYLTNETVFDLTSCPAHLVVVGGGPIGCELGQAFARLGARVSLVEMASLLPKDDPELVDILRSRLRAEQLWDSALGLIVPDLDLRRSADHGALAKWLGPALRACRARFKAGNRLLSGSKNSKRLRS